MRRMSVFFGALIAVIGLTSCGGGDPVGPPCASNTFCMLNTTFSPTTLSVSVASGATVSWTNSLNVMHDVVWDTQAGRTAALAGTGTGDIGISSSGTQTRRFTTTGTFPFHCTIHAGMNGSLTVTP